MAQTPEERKERSRLRNIEWRKANPERVKENSRKYHARIKAMKEAGGPEWEDWQAKRTAWHKEHYAKNKERESLRNKARWQRVKDKKSAERKARRLANPEFFVALREKRRKQHRARIIYVQIKALCKMQSKDFDLTLDWISERLKAGMCEMSGLPFDQEGKRTPASPSIDRIDPSQGYTQANCRMVLWFLNRALNNWGEDYACMVFERVLERRRCLALLAA